MLRVKLWRVQELTRTDPYESFVMESESTQRLRSTCQESKGSGRSNPLQLLSTINILLCLLWGLLGMILPPNPFFFTLATSTFLSTSLKSILHMFEILHHTPPTNFGWRVLAMTGEELEETEIPGFNLESQTLYCGNVVNDQLLQVSTFSTFALICCIDLF